MELLQICAVVGVAVLCLALLLQRRATYRAHVAALHAAAAKRPKRQLVIGTWTREEVARHASADDLWLIIRDEGGRGRARVYDVTDYAEEHPGGMAIMFNAGGDATEGFHGPQHPPTVHELIKEYYIGTLEDE